MTLQNNFTYSIQPFSNKMEQQQESVGTIKENIPWTPANVVIHGKNH